jgi:hypothetical protein
MSYCFKLNLPKWPIKNPKLRNNIHNNLWDVYTDIDNILSDKVLEKFESLNVNPTNVVVFCTNNNIRESAYVHVDLQWKNDSWTKVPCAINWELQPISTTIKWYDTSNCKEYWPKETFEQSPYPINYLNGLSFSDDKTKLGPPEDSILLQETTIDNSFPILFCTNTPHGVTFKSKTNDRLCVSVRFSNITSWEHAVEVFRDLFVDKV